MNHTHKKTKSSWVQWVNVHAQLAYCLKTEVLVVLSNSSISSSKSNGSKRDEHWSLTFWLNRVRCFIFGRYDPSIISQKSVTCKTEMQSLSSFWQFWLRSYKSHPLENEKFRKTMSQLSCKNRLPFEERNLLRLYCDRSCDVNQTFQRVNSLAWRAP